MTNYNAANIRNVLLAGHGGSGKTTLLEAMLFTSGAITRMGRIEDGNTTSDHEPEEVKKGISVSLSMAPVEWGGTKINVLDAPGYADFVGDMRAAVRAADAILIVVSAVDGVEVQTEAAWELAVEFGIPRAIFVNKMDRERADFERTQKQLITAFGKQVAPVELPIGAEADFRGVADLLHRKADLYSGGPIAEEGDWPEDLAELAAPAREHLMEAVAETDDTLLEKYLEEGELSDEEIVHGVKEGFASGRIAPVLVGAAAKPIGVDRVMQLIAEEFPSPLDRGAITVRTKSGEEKQRECDPNGPLTALVFKTVSDPFVGHISMFRVFEGKIRPDSTVHNSTRGADERVGQLFSLRGKDHQNTPEVPAGDIGAVAKLSATHTGDTFSTKDDPIIIQPVALPEPLLAFAIEPKTKGDEDKLSTALSRLREEDPSFQVSRSDETHETVMYGMGETHLDVMTERMKRKFGVEVTTRPAKIAYKETIKQKGKAQGRHVKQTGGHGQYAVCNIEIEPLPRGGGFEFVNKIFGGAIPSQFIGSVEKGMNKALTEGALSGNPLVDVRCTLVDGKFHPVDSSDIAFQIAGSHALKEAAEAAGIILLEPIVELEVIVPEAYTGDVMGDLNSKRGKIAGMEQSSPGKQRIKAQVPQAEVARYSIDLRSMTGGRGSFGVRFSHFEEVPAHLAAKIIAEAQAAKEAAKK
jgi:elongation factor G